MRSRYYNVTIKRFINADTERGNITNGKSLNRYSYVQGNPVSYTDPYGLSPLDNPSAMAHILFGLLGVVPGVVGATADFANAILYFMEGKYADGVISLIGGIASVFGIPCVDKMIKAGKCGKYAADIARITKLMSNAAGLLINGENTYKQSLDMYHKYFVDKKGVSAETAAELAFLAASIAGTYFSLKGIKGAVDEWRIKGKAGKSGDVITETRYQKSSGNVSELLSGRPELTGTNREKLLSAVQDDKLATCINELYRPGAIIGDGGTADALIYEFYNGKSTHLNKATERLKEINKIIKSGNLGLNDLDVAEALRDDLEIAIALFK